MKKDNLDERVYLIKYNIYESNGGSFKYALNPKHTIKREYFDRTERDKFIQRYLDLKKKDMYIDNVQCYFAELTLLSDNIMNEIIERI